MTGLACNEARKAAEAKEQAAAKQLAKQLNPVVVARKAGPTAAKKVCTNNTSEYGVPYYQNKLNL